MPYVGLESRIELQDLENEIVKTEITNPGNFNYVVSCMIREYFKTNGFNYTNINAIVGALDCAKMEMYARLARPYEDEKIEVNGDVY